MQTVIELTSRGLRVVLVRAGRVADLVELPLAPDQDPIDQLRMASLPAGMGPVRVVLHHEDLLVRTLVQPPCPRDRLDRIVRFELVGMDPAEPLLIEWQPVPAGGEEQRVLALLAKRALVDRLVAALAAHGSTLAGLTVPAAALVHAWTAQQAPADEQAVLVDVGGSRLHIAIVDAGQPVLVRTVPGGADELVRQVAERRGVAEADARAILAGLGAGAPDDLLELVRAAAGQAASAVTAAERFAKAQFRLDRLEPAAVYVAGAGAQVPAFLQALGARLGRPVRVLNPFAGVPIDVSRSHLDRIAGLPSPWGVALAAATAPALPLDVAADLRRLRRAWWLGPGALRVGAAAAVLFAVGTIVLQEVAISRAAAAVEALQGGDGLVVAARAAEVKLAEARTAKDAARRRLAWLASERMTGRAAVELLAAVAGVQDPAERPVTLGSVSLSRRADGVEASISGQAQSAGSRDPAVVLRAFEQELRLRMPAIAGMAAQPSRVEQTVLPFAYRLAIRP
jgi:hypothetical protein